jgi:hypothetical protein
MAAAADEKGDFLCLTGNSAVQKMLQKEGQPFRPRANKQQSGQ